MPPPLISIVMPVYNGANYMRLAIDSALAQDYPNVEVIVVNDGSRDGGATEAIARSYGDRIRYVRQRNGGVASALNRGLEEMSGEVFCWLSHDDIHLPRKTSRQVAAWEAAGRPDEILIGDFRIIDAAGEPVQEVRLDHAMIEAKPFYALLRGGIHGCTVFIPRRIFDEVGRFDESLPTTQDYDLWHRMGLRHRFRHVPEVLIESRSHDEQGSKQVDHRLESRDLWTRMIRDTPVALREELEGSSYRFVAATAKFLTQSGLGDVAAGLVQEAADALKGTEVTLVIPPSREINPLLGTLAAAAAQDHPATEVLVLDDGTGEAPHLLARHVARHAPRARVVQVAPGSAPAVLNAGWRAARGRYVTFLEPGSLTLPDFASSLLLAMENAGAGLGLAGHWSRKAGTGRLDRVLPDRARAFDGARPPPLSTLMLRRSLIEDGHGLPDPASAGPLPAEADGAYWRDLAARFGGVVLDRPLSVLREGALRPDRPVPFTGRAPARHSSARPPRAVSPSDIMGLT